MRFKKGNKPWNKGLTKETDERVMINIINSNKTKNSKEWKETIGKESIKKMVRTSKKLYDEGKKIPHNKGKTKKDYKPLRKLAEKQRIIRN